MNIYGERQRNLLIDAYFEARWLALLYLLTAREHLKHSKYVYAQH